MSTQLTTDLRSPAISRGLTLPQVSVNDEIIVLEDVHKSYPITQSFRDALRFWKRKRVLALSGVNLVVERGIAQGLLGANGAGKTTLLKLLAGLLLPNSGKVTVDGMDSTNDFGRIKQRLVYVSSDERQHYWRLTGRQNLMFYGRLYEVAADKLGARVDELLSLVGISDSADEMVIKYSTGMRQRLAIARGLIAEPKIMLLDEPTRSLDPPGARLIWRFIKEELMARQGVTVMIATHDMEEAAFLCDKVAVIHDGHVVVNDTVEAVTASLGTDHRVSMLLGNGDESVVQFLEQIDGIRDVKFKLRLGADGCHVDFGVDEPEVGVPRAVQSLVTRDIKVLDVSRRRNTLGDVITALVEVKS